MGIPLVKLLTATNHNVFVTSRKEHKSENNVTFLKGNATECSFLEQILPQKKWDAVIDFMIHGQEFQKLLPLFLDNTKQYVFISSARVYSQSDKPITENTPRLLDVSKDEEYLKTNEYALTKAREENLLLKAEKNNFTIIRPSITYNDYRLQLGVLEKENWLYRALHGRTIIFSNDIADKITTNTFGEDVSKGIAGIIGKTEALGEAFHITCNNSLKWSDILNIYLEVLENKLGKKVPVLFTDKSTNLNFKEKVYQVIYCRYFNRRFDNSKISRFCDVSTFLPPEKGLSECLKRFLENPQFCNIDWRLEAVNDRVSKEITPLKEIPSIKDKLIYISYRHNLKLLRLLTTFAIKVVRKIKT
jgi:dTDP-D-glucose 4,6-dehydratase